MPDVCPHCGERLPILVDAFCPACCEDLSVSPDTVSPAGDGGIRANLAKQLLAAPQAAVAFAVFGVFAAVRAALAAVEQDWEEVALYTLAAMTFAVLASRRFWNPSRVQGQSRERKAQ